jgi:SPOR domain
MTRLLLTGILFSVIHCRVNAQTVIRTDTGGIVIYADSRLDTLIRQQKQFNAIAMRFHPGYRVQVISTGNRESANEVRAKMIEQFPQYHSYLQYHAPYFRVRIGDFLNQQDADSLRDSISRIYPSGVFIVPDQINMNVVSDKGNFNDPSN